MIARFLSGLKPLIQDALSLHQLWSVFEAYNKALMFERQLARKAFVQFQAYGGSKSTQVNTQGRPTTNSAQPIKIDSVGLPSTFGVAKPVPKAAQSFTFKCYKCGEAGHKATNCKKVGFNAQGKSKTLMIEGCEDQEDEEFPIYEEEEEMCDSVLIIEDNKGGECIQEPVYDQYVEEEVDAYIEEEEYLSLVTNVLQVPKKEMEDDEWLRISSYKDMVP